MVDALLTLKRQFFWVVCRCNLSTLELLNFICKFYGPLIFLLNDAIKTLNAFGQVIPANFDGIEILFLRKNSKTIVFVFAFDPGPFNNDGNLTALKLHAVKRKHLFERNQGQVTDDDFH